MPNLRKALYNKGIMTPEGKFKKAFLAKVKKECKPVAILQYKQDSTTVKGFPDSQVILEAVCVFIEFKASKRAKFQPLQKEWIKKLNDKCHFAYVCTPENQEEILEEIKKLV